MHKVFIDTNILIDHSHGKNKILLTLLQDQKLKKTELFINPIVLAEFLNDKHLLVASKLEKVFNFLNSFQTIEINAKLGIVAGQLLRENKIIFLSDALIAATCLTHNFELVTRNTKHFQKVPRLKLFSVKLT